MRDNSKIFHTINELQNHLALVRAKKKTIGFVPTMGNLHKGHLTLINCAQNENNIVVVSIFVNPLQFAPHEDFDLYPRTLEQDLNQLVGFDQLVVFAPTVGVLYPEGKIGHTSITVPLFEGEGCAISRPHFFTGVATVVMKLLHCVQPDIAYFGEKDFQQLCVIKKMVRDCFIPVTIKGVATVREDDGLAMSSRNHYLTPEQRSVAPVIYQTLQACAAAIHARKSTFEQCIARATHALTAAGLCVDYFTICSQSTLLPAQEDDAAIVISVAAILGSTRLIDNIPLVR